MVRRIVVFWAVLVLAVTQAYAQTPTVPRGVMLDTTGKYGGQRAEIEKAAAYYGRPVKLFVSNDLPPDIDLFSHELFVEWNLPAHGLLICVFPDARKVAMTGGATLEARGVDGNYFRETVIPGGFTPAWKKGGLVEAFSSSLSVVSLQIRACPPPANCSTVTHTSNSTSMDWIGNCFLAVWVLAVFFGLLSTYRRGRHRYGPSGSDGWSSGDSGGGGGGSSDTGSGSF